ncbi:hypothetical protein [Actinoplanes sp. G11-F43]|uniref:hypothetical protein n=1 Tax=Actinoplanes sp. G11-F43 TaxID=3424130 RepID=UPI003D3587D3
MEPTSSPDNTRPSPGLSRFWQVLPDPDVPEPAEPETPADLLHGSPLGTFRSLPIPPLAPIASAARHPAGADPFGLNRAAARGPRPPVTAPPDSGPPAPERDGDPDHSVPSEDQPGAGQDVQSEEPGDSPAAGFGLGGRAGRFFATGDDPGDRDERAAPEGGTGDTPGAAAGDSQVGDEPTDEDSAGTAEQISPASGQDAAEVAGHSDENGRDDMNGRAGAPGYAQTGEAGPDGTGDAADEPQTPSEPVRPAAGWASVPVPAGPVTPISGGPISGGPVSGMPVSPAYTPNPYSVADFTPDHPAGTLSPAPVSGQPVAATTAPVEEPADPAGSAPVSAAPAPERAAVQIPATRPPSDPVAEPAAEPATGGYPGLPPAAEGGYGFAPAGFSLGRPPAEPSSRPVEPLGRPSEALTRPSEAFGMASVTPAPAGPTPPTFLGAETSLTIDVPARPEPGRRPVAPEDGGTGHRTGRRAAPEEPAPAITPLITPVVAPVSAAVAAPVSAAAVAPVSAAAPAVVPVAEPHADDPVIGRSVWDEDAARHFRAAWHEVKAEFVDDPVTALTRAHDLLTDAVNELTEVLLAERDELDPLRGNGTPDTESMRMAMRGYREYLERILSL